MVKTHKRDLQKEISILEKNRIKEELNNAEKLPVLIDEDSPSYSEEEMKRLIEIARQKNELRKKSLVSLRIDQDSINIAKSFGEGYTALMSRVLYYGLRDPEILEKAL